MLTHRRSLMLNFLQCTSTVAAKINSFQFFCKKVKSARLLNDIPIETMFHGGIIMISTVKRHIRRSVMQSRESSKGLLKTKSRPNFKMNSTFDVNFLQTCMNLSRKHRNVAQVIKEIPLVKNKEMRLMKNVPLVASLHTSHRDSNNRSKLTVHDSYEIGLRKKSHQLIFRSTHQNDPNGNNGELFIIGLNKNSTAFNFRTIFDRNGDYANTLRSKYNKFMTLDEMEAIQGCLNMIGIINDKKPNLYSTPYNPTLPYKTTLPYLFTALTWFNIK